MYKNSSDYLQCPPSREISRGVKHIGKPCKIYGLLSKYYSRTAENKGTWSFACRGPGPGEGPGSTKHNSPRRQDGSPGRGLPNEVSAVSPRLAVTSLPTAGIVCGHPLRPCLVAARRQGSRSATFPALQEPTQSAGPCGTRAPEVLTPPRTRGIQTANTSLS